MPSQTEIENAVTAVLDRRAHETQAAQRELERATAIRAQRGWAKLKQRPEPSGKLGRNRLRFLRLNSAIVTTVV